MIYLLLILLLFFNKIKSYDESIAIKSIILASLCYNNLKSYYNFSIDLLLTFLRNFVRHGMHYLRSPSEHFFLLCSLVDIKNFLGSHNKKIPEELNQF